MDCRGLSKEHMMSVATEGKLFIWMDGACKLMQFLYARWALSRNVSCSLADPSFLISGHALSDLEMRIEVKEREGEKERKMRGRKEKERGKKCTNCRRSTYDERERP
jgi:hypothetical protein